MVKRSLNGWVLFYKISGCEFESGSCHLNQWYLSRNEAYSIYFNNCYILWKKTVAFCNKKGDAFCNKIP